MTGMNVDKPQMIKKNLMLTEQENVDEQKSSGVRILDYHIFKKINDVIDILGWYIEKYVSQLDLIH